MNILFTFSNVFLTCLPGWRNWVQEEFPSNQGTANRHHLQASHHSLLPPHTTAQSSATVILMNVILTPDNSMIITFHFFFGLHHPIPQKQAYVPHPPNWLDVGSQKILIHCFRPIIVVQFTDHWRIVIIRNCAHLLLCIIVLKRCMLWIRFGIFYSSLSVCVSMYWGLVKSSFWWSLAWLLVWTHGKRVAGSQFDCCYLMLCLHRDETKTKS